MGVSTTFLKAGDSFRSVTVYAFGKKEEKHPSLEI